jgi:hypothetical protein
MGVEEQVTEGNRVASSIPPGQSSHLRTIDERPIVGTHPFRARPPLPIIGAS